MSTGVGAPRSLLGLRDVPPETIVGILDQAMALRARTEAGEAGPQVLAGRTVALLFFEPSTRTRFSFEMAAKNLGARVVAFSSAQSSATKGESLLDTARTLRSVGVDAFVIRHKQPGAPHVVSQRLGYPVLNAGDGIDEHPTQALLDALTLRDRLGDLTGRTIAIVGDVKHSRVARSNCFALTKLGARVVLAGPGTLCPDEMTHLGVEVRHRIEEATVDADAVMMLRIQRERMRPGLLPSNEEYSNLYGLDSGRLRPGVTVLHPAPMNRGVEIGDAVADGLQSAVFEQIRNGVFVRMACLMHVMGEGVS